MQHGTSDGYNRHGCRCKECCGANTLAAQKQRALKAARRRDCKHPKWRKHDIYREVCCLCDQTRKMAESVPGMKRPSNKYGIVPLADVERENIEYAVEVTGSMAQAAELLGIGRTQLYRKIRLYRESDKKPAVTGS